MTSVIDFALTHQFLTGLITGGALFGGFCGLIGWSMGKADAMAQAHSWLVDDHLDQHEAHGDVVLLMPPRRDRRYPGRP